MLIKKTLLATTLLLGLTKAYAGCSVHDHLCSYHALGTPTTSYNQNQDTSLVIFSAATQVGGGTNNTVDFDNHVLLPDQAIDLSTGQVSSTEPFVYSTTSYGANNPSTISEWNTVDTQPRHVYPSQYRVDFNQLTATAKHTGDYNGGEKDNIPDATGCPNLGVNSPNCEAVVINKNVPTGIYSQKVQMFNFHDLDDPSAEIVVGAYATGQGTIINQSHLPSGTTTATVNPADATLTENGVVYQTINLSGDQAQSGQFDYSFYNRGFDPHASGTIGFDHKVYHDKGYKTYKQYDDKTNTVNTYREQYYAYDTNRQTIDGATGRLNNEIVQYGKTYANTQLIGSRVIPITNRAFIGANQGISLPADTYVASGVLNGIPKNLPFVSEAPTPPSIQDSVIQAVDNYKQNGQNYMDNKSFTSVMDEGTRRIDDRLTEDFRVALYSDKPIWDKAWAWGSIVYHTPSKIGDNVGRFLVGDIISSAEKCVAILDGGSCVKIASEVIKPFKIIEKTTGVDTGAIIKNINNQGIGKKVVNNNSISIDTKKAKESLLQNNKSAVVDKTFYNTQNIKLGKDGKANIDNTNLFYKSPSFPGKDGTIYHDISKLGSNTFDKSVEPNIIRIGPNDGISKYIGKTGNNEKIYRYESGGYFTINPDTGKKSKVQVKDLPEKYKIDQGKVLSENNARHNKAAQETEDYFSKDSNITVTTEVSIKNPLTLEKGARIDQVLSEGKGQTIAVPDGYTAIDLRTGKTVTTIKLDNKGKAGVEIKTGKAELTENQKINYSNCLANNGCAIGTGPRAAQANILEIPPTNIYIIRPIE